MKEAPLDLLGRKKNALVSVPNTTTTRRVTVLEDHNMKMPELWLSVFVFGPEAGPNFTKLFARAKCTKAETPDDADLVVFTGNASDIDPQLYGEKPHKSTLINPTVDKENLTLYHFCANRGIPMFGVCGGAQLLHVAQGGKLYQDIDGHNEQHTMWAVRDREFIQKVSSVHHQMCIPNREGGMEVLGASHVAQERWVNDIECVKGNHQDVEAFWYRDTACFGVQGHPEYAGFNKYTVWVLEQLDRLLNENPDLSYRVNEAGTNRLRIKEALLEERKNKKAASITVVPNDNIIVVEQTKG